MCGGSAGLARWFCGMVFEGVYGLGILRRALWDGCSGSGWGRAPELSVVLCVRALN